MEGRKKGFTLIELVLLIGLLGIVSLAAISYFPNLGEVRSEAVARRLVSDLAYARQLARTRNAVHGISFDAAMESYTVFVFDPSTGNETPVVSPLTQSAMIVDLTQLPATANVNLRDPVFGTTSEVRFTPQGDSQDGNGAALTATGSVVFESGGVSRTVFVQPRTGEVSYQ